MVVYLNNFKMFQNEHLLKGDLEESKENTRMLIQTFYGFYSYKSIDKINISKKNP